MSSEVNENRQRHAAATSNGEPDQLISVISDVERQLSLLRTLKEEREASRQRIADAEARLQEHAAELSRREQALDAGERSIEESRRELEQRSAELAERHRAFERASQQRQSELDALGATLQTQAVELEARSEQTRSRGEALDRQAATLTADRQALDQAEAELARRERAMADARAEFDRLRQRVAELEQELARANELAEQRAAELTRRTTMAQGLAQQVDELRSAVEAKGVELAAHVQSEAALRAELGSIRDQLAAQCQAGARLEQDLHALRAALDQSESRGRELESEVARQQAAAQALGRARDQIRAELEQQVRRMEEEQATLHQAKAEAQHLAAAVKTADGAVLDLRRQVVERDAKIQFLSQRITTIMAERDQQLAELRQSLTGRLDTDDAAAREIADRDRRLTELQLALSARDRRIEELAQAAQEAASLRRQAEEARARAGELQAALDERERALGQSDTAARDHEQRLAAAEARIAELQLQLENASAASPVDPEQTERLHALADEVARLRSAIGERDAAIERLRSGAAQSSSTAADAQALEQLQADTDALRAELDEARERLADSLQENRRLRERAASAGDGADLPEHLVEAIASRRRRLSRVRAALRRQHEKLTRASDGLRQRYEQCEQILAQRDQLAAARQALVETQRRLDRQVARAAKVKVAAGVFYVIASLAGLAGLSWAASAPLSTQVYVASASIGVKDDGRYQNPEAVQHWQTYVESLRTDPLFRSGLSESLLRAGFASKSTAGEVAALLENELRITSPSAGQLDFALQGEGAARTQRLLETVTTAYLSEARATKDRRVDQLDTDLRQPAAADPTPIHDDRPMVAGGIFLPLVGITFIIGGLVWRRLATSKTKFEAQSLADSALDPALWRGAQAAIASTEPIR